MTKKEILIIAWLFTKYKAMCVEIVELAQLKIMWQRKLGRIRIDFEGLFRGLRNQLLPKYRGFEELLEYALVKNAIACKGALNQQGE